MIHDEHVKDDERRVREPAREPLRASPSAASTRTSPSGSSPAPAPPSTRAADTSTSSTCPGAFELPLAAKYCAESGRYDGVACLGAVIRGETDHYDFVCSEAARGIQDVQLRTGRAVRVRRADRGEHGPGAGAHRRGQARPGPPRRGGHHAMAALRSSLACPERVTLRAWSRAPSIAILVLTLVHFGAFALLFWHLAGREIFGVFRIDPGDDAGPRRDDPAPEDPRGAARRRRAAAGRRSGARPPARARPHRGRLPAAARAARSTCPASPSAPPRSDRRSTLPKRATLRPRCVHGSPFSP